MPVAAEGSDGFCTSSETTEAQALARARVSEDDKGGFAARACLGMIDIKRRLLGQVR